MQPNYHASLRENAGRNPMPSTASVRQTDTNTTADLIAGVSVTSSSAQALERRITLAAVIIPFLGLIASTVLLWRRLIGPLELWIFAVMYVLNIVGIGVGYHRLLTHRAFQTTKPIRIMLAILGSLAAQGPV